MEVQATFWHSNILEQNKLSARMFLGSKWCWATSAFTFKILAAQLCNFVKCPQVGKTDLSPEGNVFVMVRMDKQQLHTTSAHSQYVWIHMLNFLPLDISSVHFRATEISKH